MTGLCMTNFDRGLKERSESLSIYLRVLPRSTDIRFFPRTAVPGYHFTWSRSQRREATEKPVIDGDGTPLGRTQTRMSID